MKGSDRPDARGTDRVAEEAPEAAAVRRQVLLNTFSNYAGYFVGLAVWFALTPFILDQLGATLYGLWALIASLVAYGAPIDLGVGLAVTRYVAEFRARGELGGASGLVATALLLFCTLGLVAVALSVPLALIAPEIINVPDDERNTLSWLVVLTGVAIGVQLPATTAYAVLRGLQRFDFINLISVLGTLLMAGSIAGVLLLGGGVLGMAAVMIPLTLLWQVPMIRFIRRTAPELEFGWRGARRDLLRTIAGFSSSVFFINAAGMFKKKTDEFVIGAVLPIARVTPYNIGRRLSDAPELLTHQFIQVMLPLASHLHGKEDRARLRALFVASTRLTLAIFIPVAGALVVLADPLITAWVGEAYDEAAQIVLILTCAGILEITLWPATSVLQGIGRHRPLALFAVGSAMLNLGLSILLVHSNGIQGVALGTLIATAAEVLVVTPYALSVNGVSLRAAVVEAFVPALAPAAPMLLALMGLRELVDPTSLIVVGAIGLAGVPVYVACYLAFRVTFWERQIALRLAFGARVRLRALLP